MKSRRSFLLGMGTLTMSQLLSACQDSSTYLRIYLLQNSLPSELISRFKKQVSEAISFKPLAQLKDTYKVFKEKPASSPIPFISEWHIPFLSGDSHLPADLVTIGDYYLGEAIEKKWIKPLEVEKIAAWKKLPPKFQELVKRDPNGSIWAAPYRWGMTIIAYDEEKLKTAGLKPPQDWSDLWREEYRNHLSLLDQPREVIGLTLKKLGYSYNTKDLDKIPNLKDTLAKLHQNVKFYSTDNYLEPLIFGDIWITVGWSNELLSLQESYPKIKLVIPPSGTSLWSDLWVKNVKSVATEAVVNQWIDFCWQVKAVNEISLLTSASSPMIYSVAKTDIVQDVLNNPLLYVDQNIFDKSEFLSPLPTKSLQLYDTFWQNMRQSK